jgi:hypothetical protein
VSFEQVPRLLSYLRKRALNPKKRISELKLVVANQSVKRMNSREMVNQNILYFQNTLL